MPQKILNIIAAFKSASEDDGSVKIKGMASVATPDRLQDVIPIDAWKKGLTNFKKNPIILFNHNYSSPAGRATSISPVANGLALEATISAHAPNNVAGLIKDGVLGAFSVGFIIKDADYIEETGGLLIKEAELLEVSVVSVPMHQDATFSVAKSFDSAEEYKAYVKTLGINIPLKENSLNEGVQIPSMGKKSQQEIEMDPKDLEKLLAEAAATAAEKAITKMKADQAAEKAAAAAVAAKEAADQAAAKSIKVEVTQGVEALVKDFEIKLAEKDASFQDVVNTFKADLTAAKEELTKMQNSKRFFDDRGNIKGRGEMAAYARELAEAKLFGVVTGQKDLSKNRMVLDIAEKAGFDATNVGSMDTLITDTIEKEIQLATTVANLFREIPVKTGSTVLTVQLDSGRAAWGTAAASGNLEDRGQTVAANTYAPAEVTLVANRLISSTYLDDNTDEQNLPNFMPLLLDSVVRAHARAVDYGIINGGNAAMTGLDASATAITNLLGIGAAEKLDGADLAAARNLMGRYGINPSDVVYIVSVAQYLNLLDDPEFHDIQEIGNDAVKLKGQIGRIWGSPVVVSDEFVTAAAGTPAALAVYPKNYVIPRLRGITLEMDRDVQNQRNFIVAVQALGHKQLVAGASGARPVTKVDYEA